MTRLNNTRMLTLTAALAMAAAIGIFTQSGPVSAATSVLSCEGDSRQKIIDCCQKAYNKHQPLWMMNSHVSCHEVVQCRAAKRSVTGAPAVNRCWVKYQPPSPNDTKPRPEPKDPQTRGSLK